MPDIPSIFQRIGIVGAGSMGSMMASAFLQLGFDVSIWDISRENIDRVLDTTKKDKNEVKSTTLDGFIDINKFVCSLEQLEKRLFVFSITHGHATDSVLEKLGDNLKRGDIVLDGGNENYRTTERRQKELHQRGVSWVGMGVSGGYQSARHGPSLSPGGSKEAVDTVFPFLERYAARDPKSGQPCVAYIGPHGSGHFVKMVHNGIENGMLSTMCEAWSLLHKSHGMEYDEIGDIFRKWNEEGELRDTFLVKIASEICKTKKPEEGSKDQGQPVTEWMLDEVLDKVVQDDDNSEGTLYWTVMEAAKRHVAAPTIATGHFIRVASGNRSQRLQVADKLCIPEPTKVKISEKDKLAFIETIRRAVFASFLCAFCQGLELIARASQDEGWNVSLATCIRIWRAGCIIQEGYIADLLEPILKSAEGDNVTVMNLKLIDEVSAALRENYPSLKETVLRATEWDNYIPSMSASLEYLKYVGGKMLPTQFMEAQLDFFGAHAYDRPNVPGEDPGKPKKGAHHYEWRPV